MEIEIYWTREKGIHYRDNGMEIPALELVRRLRKGEKYEKIEIKWEGVMPVNNLFEMQKRRSKLEEIANNLN
jgi:hypothetical protein